MKSRALLIGAVLVLVPLLVPAAESEKAPDIAPVPAGEIARDIQDIVYFTDTRPVVVRLHIEVDGKPFQERWETFMAKLYQHVDRDGDGVLSTSEAGRAFGPAHLQQIFRGNVFNTVPGGAVNVNEMDADTNDQISLEEFINYYRRSSAGPVAAQPGLSRGPQDALTNALFNQLDQDKDGKLSKDELAGAGRSMRRLDQDDDELVSLQELVPGTNPQALQPQFQPQPPRAGAGLPMLPDDSDFFPIIPDGSPKRLTQRLQLVAKVLKRYDKNTNDRISRNEIGFDDATFKRLDANGDGNLDSTELLRLLNPPADMELVLRLGRMEGAKPAAEIMTLDGKPYPLASAVQKTSTGSLMLTLGEAQIDVRRSESQQVAGANFRQTYLQQFRLADREKQGFLEMRNVQQAQYQFLRTIFPMADRDGDLKLTEKELEAFADLQGAAVNCTTTLTVSDNGHGLFEMLDSNRDGKLGLRELRTMWARLAPFDRDKDGGILKSELPHQFQVAVSPGLPLNFGRPVVVNPGFGVPAPAAVSTVGPLWFRKMDRNGDGDISLREFFGSREDFDRIDTDGDGLISLEEAEKADRMFRK